MIAPDLWHWERRHPEWHPGDFGAVVGSYAARLGDVTLLIDPLIDGADDPMVADLDQLVKGRVRIVITIPYHTRSAEFLWDRYREHGARILGHRLVARRLNDTSGFTALEGGETIEGVARTHRIGKPVRAEIPLEIPALRALVFGDAVVEYEGQIRVWDSPLASENRRRWYEDRFLPTLRPLVDTDPERILVTHGRPVLAGGRQALQRALESGPWHPPPAGSHRSMDRQSEKGSQR